MKRDAKDFVKGLQLVGAHVEHQRINGKSHRSIVACMQSSKGDSVSPIIINWIDKMMDKQVELPN